MSSKALESDVSDVTNLIFMKSNSCYYLKWKDIIFFENYLFKNKEQIIIITYTIQVMNVRFINVEKRFRK